MARVLIVDDDPGMKEFLQIMLEKEGYDVTTASSGTEALNLCKRHGYDLVLTDLRMPRMDGIDVLKAIKEVSPETVVILITAYASGETAVAAMREGAYDYVEKNFDIEELKQTVRDSLKQKGVVQKEDAGFERTADDAVIFSQMVGKSKEMLRLYSLVKKVADTPANVLILGESGTGKELVARAIHEHSSRRQRLFVTINCGGIPENLLESELFGYMKGSFTGAYSDKMGLFEVAGGGTVFLDEIAELPPVLQVKLLRAVQEKTFRRIGGSEDIKADFRIISATHQNLPEMVKDGRFREDLYYRLNVIPVEIPPLRKRKEDIPALTKYFIEKYSLELGKEIKKISAYAVELLMNYEFPGNVRELENIIERSVALETSSIILPENLVIARERKEAFDLMNHVRNMVIPDEGLNLNETMTAIEARIIEVALEKANGSKTKAAELLRISFPSFRHRLEKLKMH